MRRNPRATKSSVRDAIIENGGNLKVTAKSFGISAVKLKKLIEEFELDEVAWRLSMDHYPYPDDLPFPRNREYGPIEPSVAARFLDADYPLPGTWSETVATRDERVAPAWVTHIEDGAIYPGAKLSPSQKAVRDELVKSFANSGYSDLAAGKKLARMDRETGYSPLFGFQYAVLNFSHFSQVIVFKLNGEHHILHWDNRQGYAIDKEYISDDPELALDDFYLFELIGSSLGSQEHLYPVVSVSKVFHGSPDYVWKRIPSGPPSTGSLTSMGVKL